MRDKVVWKLVISVAIIMAVGGIAIYSQDDIGKEGKGGERSISQLIAPLFIKASASGGGGGAGGTSFLVEEAGISAYTNVGEAINIEKAKSAFRTIEYETEEYIIGSVPLPDYPETEDVHAYVHKDGWVLVYYLKDEPAAKIIDWNDYGRDEKIKGTKLEDAISVICNNAGVPIGDIKYYDFRHPNADKLMIVADAIWSSGTDTFRIKLPSDFVFYERSFSHYCKKRSGYYTDSRMYIDGNQISHTSEGGTNYGLILPTQLSLDQFHTIKITGSSYNIGAFGAIVLIYREA